MAYKRRLHGSTHHGSLSQIHWENQRKTKAADKYKYIVLQDDFWKASTANNLNAHELGAGGAVSAQWNNHTMYRSVDMCAPSTAAFTAGCQFLGKEGHKYMC